MAFWGERWGAGLLQDTQERVAATSETLADDDMLCRALQPVKGGHIAFGADEVVYSVFEDMPGDVHEYAGAMDQRARGRRRGNNEEWDFSSGTLCRKRADPPQSRSGGRPQWRTTSRRCTN